MQKVSGAATNLLLLLLLIISLLDVVKAYEAVNSTRIRIENNSGQRDYSEQEEGKVLPFRYDSVQCVKKASNLQQHEYGNILKTIKLNFWPKELGWYSD